MAQFEAICSGRFHWFYHQRKTLGCGKAGHLASDRTASWDDRWVKPVPSWGLELRVRAHERRGQQRGKPGKSHEKRCHHVKSRGLCHEKRRRWKKVLIKRPGLLLSSHSKRSLSVHPIPSGSHEKPSERRATLLPYLRFEVLGSKHTRPPPSDSEKEWRRTVCSSPSTSPCAVTHHPSPNLGTLLTMRTASILHEGKEPAAGIQRKTDATPNTSEDATYREPLESPLLLFPRPTRPTSPHPSSFLAPSARTAGQRLSRSPAESSIGPPRPRREVEDRQAFLESHRGVPRFERGGCRELSHSSPRCVFSEGVVPNAPPKQRIHFVWNLLRSPTSSELKLFGHKSYTIHLKPLLHPCSERKIKRLPALSAWYFRFRIKTQQNKTNQSPRQRRSCCTCLSRRFTAPPLLRRPMSSLRASVIFTPESPPQMIAKGAAT